MYIYTNVCVCVPKCKLQIHVDFTYHTSGISVIDFTEVTFHFSLLKRFDTTLILFPNTSSKPSILRFCIESLDENWPVSM